MIEYRPFLNSDAPLVAEIWRNQTPLRAVTSEVTPAILEEHVFSKLFFDRRGLIVAAEDHRKLVGFVHAGFSSNEAGSEISTAVGLINLLMTTPRPDRVMIGGQLLLHAEQYLHDRGATSVKAGSLDQLGPFYLGLYGGCQLPGVLTGDETWRNVLTAAEYQEVEHRLIFQKEISDFRPPVDRQMLQLRRQAKISLQDDPIPVSWWEACTTGDLQRTKICLTSKSDDQVIAEASFWNIEPLASHWGVHAMGLLKIESSHAPQQLGSESFLLVESLRQFRQQGITIVEIHASEKDLQRVDLLQRLGFEEIDRGIEFEKRETA